MSALCFVDTETTGVHPDREVWEVAMIRRDDEGQRELSFFVEVDLEQADPVGLSIGRFYERPPLGRFLSRRLARRDRAEPDDDADFYLSEREAALRVARFTHGAHLVGAVPNFDAEVLDRLLRAFWLVPAWHYHLIDVESIAVGFLHGLSSTPEHYADLSLPWDSDGLSRACGVEPANDEERHTALGDARWAMRLYDAITGGSK